MADREAILQELNSRFDSLQPKQQAIVQELKSRMPGQASAAGTNPMVDANGEEATVPARSGSPMEVVKPAILPTLGQIGGGLIGGRFGGRRGAIVGESAGGGLGGMLNQVLGITEPSVREPLIDAAVPPAVRGVVGATRIGKQMFGQTGAANINRLLPEEASTRVSQYMPQTPASTLFQQAEQQGTQIPLTTQAIDDAVNHIGRLSSGAQKQFGEIVDYSKGLKDMIVANGGQLSPIALQNELAAISNIITKFQRNGTPGLDRLVKIKSELLDGLDTAAQAGTPGAQTLQSARHTYQRQESVKELGEYIEKAVNLKRGVGSDTQFNPNQVLKNLQKDRFFTKSFSQAEQAEIVNMLEMMNKAPVIGPGAGQSWGSGKAMQSLWLSSGAGAAGHYATGDPEITAGFALAGAAYPHIKDVAHNIALAMQTGTGRKFLKGLLTNSGGAITPQVMTSLGEFMGGMTAKAKQPQAVSEARTRVQPMDVEQ